MALSNEKKKQVIITSIILLTILIGYFLIYKPLMVQEDIFSAKLDEAGKRNQMLSAVNYLNSLIGSYEKRISQTTDQSWLLNQISSAANKSGVRIVSMEPQARQDLGDYTRFSAKIEAEADFHQLGKFLSILENLYQIMKVDSLEIKSAPELERLGSVGELAPRGIPKVSMVLSTYVMKR